jgi:PPOX class probable F420-dependent enzyme
MNITGHLTAGHRQHVEERLRRNLIAWLTTVRPDGQPECVPVWFLTRDDESMLIYSQPTARKLANIRSNPQVALALDVSDLGRDNVRVNGTAARADDVPSAIRNDPYLAKYAERIAAMFGAPEKFSDLFSVPVLVTPTRLLSPVPTEGIAFS